MRTKSIIFFSIFIFLFFMQCGIFYIIIFKPSLIFIIESFLASSLIMCFSFGFILIDFGLKEDIRNNKNVVFRYLGMILILISFGISMLIVLDINNIGVF